MNEVNKRRIGSEYEGIAKLYLQSIGYEIWEHNYRCRLGEIDLIGMDTADGCICFIEVKYRRSARYGMPGEAVSAAKQKKIISVSQVYLSEHRLGSARYRYDVAEILGDKVRVIKNAFGMNF